MPALTITDTEKFLARVEQRGPAQCWWWNGAVDQSTGFPRMKQRGGSQRSVARFGWEIAYMKGPIPQGFVIIRAEHEWDRCPDPASCIHRLCLNPAHMKLARKSVLDADRLRSISERTKTVCRRGHTLTDDNVVWLNRPKNKRACRICHDNLLAQYRAQR